MDRRALLRGLVAAPAVVAIGSLMPVRSIERLIPTLWGDGVHDDAPALSAMMGGELYRHNGMIQRAVGDHVIIPPGEYYVRTTFTIQSREPKGRVLLHNSNIRGSVSPLVDIGRGADVRHCAFWQDAAGDGVARTIAIGDIRHPGG